ncbi:MAG: hypothetical protein GKR95_25190 [Gammaproteobacteria bacterium]|nr:hypothetical protein [Gammaproteobacteria bacterium]
MKKNLLLLAVCQALMLSSISMMMSSSALVGIEIAPTERLELSGPPNKSF